MQFIVPQFIDVENKIIGPISTRQFILLVAMFIVAFVLFKIAPVWLFALGLVLDIIICGSFAFVKVNSQPLHVFFVVLLQTFRKPHLRVWMKETGTTAIAKKGEAKKVSKTVIVKRISSKSRLAELSLMLDTGGVYQEYEEPNIKNINNVSQQINH